MDLGIDWFNAPTGTLKIGAKMYQNWVPRLEHLGGGNVVKKLSLKMQLVLVTVVAILVSIAVALGLIFKTVLWKKYIWNIGATFAI